MGKPKLDFLFRDLTQLGLPKSQFSLINDEKAYNYNPDRYNFYMQLLDDVADPDQKIASKVLGVLARNRRQHERIQEKIDGIANAIHYLKNKYTKPAVIGEPREYGELATLKDDLNNKLKRIPIVSKEYEIDTDFAKMETSDIEKQKIQGKVEELLQEDPTLKNEMRLTELESTLNELERKITALTPDDTKGTAEGAMSRGTAEEGIAERMENYKTELEKYRTKITAEPSTEQSTDSKNEGGLKNRNQDIRKKINEIRTEIKYLKDEKQLAEKSKALNDQKDEAKKLEVEIGNLEREIDMLNKKIYADDVKIVDGILKMASDNAEIITKTAEETKKLQEQIDAKQKLVDEAIAKGAEVDQRLSDEIKKLEDRLSENNLNYTDLEEGLVILLEQLKASFAGLFDEQRQTNEQIQDLMRQLADTTDGQVKEIISKQITSLKENYKVITKRMKNLNTQIQITETKAPGFLKRLGYNLRIALGKAPDKLEDNNNIIIKNINKNKLTEIRIDDKYSYSSYYNLTINENTGTNTAKFNIGGDNIDIVLHDQLSYFKDPQSTEEIFVFVRVPTPAAPTTTSASSSSTTSTTPTPSAANASATPPAAPKAAPSTTPVPSSKLLTNGDFIIKPTNNTNEITGDIYRFPIRYSFSIREYENNLFNPIDIIEEIVNKPISVTNKVGTFKIKLQQPQVTTEGGGRKKGGSPDFMDMVEYMARQQGGSWFGERAKEFQEIDEKTKLKMLRTRKDIEAAEDDILLEYKNHPLYSPENQEVTFTDRLVFVGITFVFRAISLFMVEWGINTKLIKSFNGCVVVYVVMYLLLFSIWVLLVNIRKNNLFFGMLFYYINSNYNTLVRKRILIHMAIQLIMLVTPFAVADPSIVGSSEIDTFDKKERVMNTISMFTFIIWFLTSFVALRA